MLELVSIAFQHPNQWNRGGISADVVPVGERHQQIHLLPDQFTVRERCTRGKVKGKELTHPAESLFLYLLQFIVPPFLDGVEVIEGIKPLAKFNPLYWLMYIRPRV